METPGEPQAAVTGVAAPKAAPVETESEWTVEELQAGKPILLYYYIDGLDETQGAKDPDLKFARSFEEGAINNRVIAELNDKWRCKKVAIPSDADRKQPKNQSRIEFWSFTGSRMGEIALKERGQFEGAGLMAQLKSMRTKNAAIAAKEIKRIEDLAKAREKAEREAEKKETAAK